MKKNIGYLTLATLIFLFGCKKNENKEVSPDYLLEINVNAEFTAMFDGVSDIFVWLTASSGEIIADTNLTLGAQIKIERPEGFTDERFSYHILTYKNDDSYRINTYANIKKGEINYQNYYNNRGEKAGEVTLTFTDIPEYDMYSIDDGWGSMSSNGQLNTYVTDVYENVDWFYISLWNETSKYYQFIDNIEAGVERTVSLANMKTNFTEYNISFDKSGYNNVSAYAYDEENFLGRSISLGYVSESLTAPASLSFFVPQGEERFKSFSYSLYCNPDNSDKSYGYSSYGDAPTSMKYINADIELTNFDINTYELGATGEFDYAQIWFSSYQEGKFLNWSVYDGTGDDIKFPVLPEKVETKYPTIKKDQIINIDTYCTISLEDVDNIVSYDDVIDVMLNRSGKMWLDGATESKRISLRPNFNGKKTNRNDHFNERDRYPGR